MSENEWTREFFVKRGRFFLKIMNSRWSKAEVTTQGITKILATNKIETGRILDLCCGNGRLAIWLAKNGFKVVGIDLSPLYIKDAIRRAKEFNVESDVKFLVGDMRTVDEIEGADGLFDAVINF